FKTLGNGLAAGESDLFEYTLPPQADPVFIHATARLASQVFYETHLNVFDCTVQPVANRENQAAQIAAPAEPLGNLAWVFPNPVMGVLQVRNTAWAGQAIRVQISDALGTEIWTQTMWPDALGFELEIPAQWPAGLYYLRWTDETGADQTLRFIRAWPR
ncbi:MAG: T9SS type A sorting domain-containing protein, partial [Saprospiraceae bacterium]|nr:T9SS type A sorting domain-containing protein [Saprospiraceae bacterium]